MNRPVTSATMLLLALTVGACAQPEAAPPKTEATPKDPGPVASANTAAATTATPSASAAPAAPKGPSVTAFVGDDPGKTVKLSGPSAWTLGPGDSWSLGLYDYVRADGTKNIFKSPANENLFAVPSAFSAEPSAEARKAWKKGDAVLVAPSRSAECGRVVEAGADGVVKVAFEFAGKTETQVAQAHDLLPLTGRMELGAPVAYKTKPEDDAFRSSYLVYTDGKSAWLSGRKEAPVSLVKTIDVNRVFKKGDKVFADSVDTKGKYQPATIAGVLDGGIRYELTFADGKKGTAKFCRVVAQLP